jgi:hypothetical protein
LPGIVALAGREGEQQQEEKRAGHTAGFRRRRLAGTMGT